MSRFYFGLLVSSVLLFCGCQPTAPKAPDVKDVNVSLKTSRFDVDLYSLDSSNLKPGLQQLKQKYPDFLDYFLDTIMTYNIRGNYDDTCTGIKEGLRMFLTFKDFRDLEDSIQFHYPDTKDVDEALAAGFKLVKYYFPSNNIPRIIYLNMGLSKWPSFPIDTNTLCVGLDMFLGDHFPFYVSVGVPDYMNAHMRKSYLPVSLFGTYYKMRHPFVQDERTLLDLILQRGREQYYLHKILPAQPDSVLFGFTQVQLKWCTKNEPDIYNFFVSNNLLYNKESVGRFAFVNDGPFAQGMEAPNDPVKYSPGNVGTWLGYRIVCAYMEHNPKVTLYELINKPIDPAKFLEMAKYKPR